MEKTLAFGEVLEIIDKMSRDEQKAIAEVLHRRLVESRRNQLADDIQQAQQEFQKGNCRVATPEEIMEELLA